MSENKTLECSSDETTNEWKVGPGAWISLVIVLLVFSGLLFKVEWRGWPGWGHLTLPLSAVRSAP